MAKFNLETCPRQSIDELCEYIDSDWVKNHIFVQSRTLLDWQHKNSKDNNYNFIIARDAKSDEICGVLGFIFSSHFSPQLEDERDVWLAIWKVREGAKYSGLGLRMLGFLKREHKVKTICSIGLSEIVVPMYKLLNFEVGQLKQFVLVNNKLSEYQILQTGSYKEKKVGLSEQYTLELLTTENLSNISPEIEKTIFTCTPQKNIEYILNRYAKHPMYHYEVFSVNNRNAIKSLLITRTITINGANDNTAPSLSAASYTISEDSAVGAIVGQVVATDLETPGSLVYSFDDDGTSKYDMFLINSSTGEITFSGTDGVNTFNLDYETVPNLYQLDVKVTDPSGLFDIKTMDINVSDLNLLVTGGGTVMVSNTNNAGGSTVDNGGQYGSHSEYFAFTDIVIAAGETISIELILSGNSNSYTGSNAHSYLVYDSDLNDSNNTLVTIHSVDETAGSYNGTWTITFDYENTSGSDITINTIYVSGKNNGFDFETYTVTSPETQDQVLTFDSATNNIDMLQLFSNAEDFEPDFVPTSLDIVDITAGNHILSNILAVDVLVMTDSDDTLKIIGDSNDSITLPTSEWTEGATAGGITTYTATNGNGAILEIESDINIIL